MTYDYLLIFVSEWKSNTSLTKQINNMIFYLWKVFSGILRCFLQKWWIKNRLHIWNPSLLIHVCSALSIITLTVNLIFFSSLQHSPDSHCSYWDFCSCQIILQGLIWGAWLLGAGCDQSQHSIWSHRSSFESHSTG